MKQHLPESQFLDYFTRLQHFRKLLHVGNTQQYLRNIPRCLIIILLLCTFLLSPIASLPTYAQSVPTLVAPVNGATTTTANHPPLGIPELKWNAVPGATSYRLQISSDIGFTTKVEVITSSTSYTPIDAKNFSDGTWYWRVQVYRPLPVGEFSGAWSFTKQWATDNNLPKLLAPADKTEIDFFDRHMDFSWEPVTGAAKYKLQIYASPGGWATLTYTATTLATAHQPKDKLANGTYYWRVVPVDPGNRDGTPSVERQFTVNYNPPQTILGDGLPALRLLEPADHAEPTFTPTLRWTAVQGAEYYRLQYSTDPSFGANVTQIDTRNTSHTPTITLPNDVNYYWRVRVHSGNSMSDWTASRTFIKKWYLKPVLLTPTNNYQHQRYPLFSWTPVPGASYYKIEISQSPGFPLPLFDSGETANTYYSLNNYNYAVGTHYWRVTPYDGSGNAGLTSNTASFNMDPSSLAPHQVYPLFYYPPDNYIDSEGKPIHTTHEDRTVPYPIFIWHRLYSPSGAPDQGEVYPDAYRLQVSKDPLFFSVDWSVDTENTVATPTTSNLFAPLTDTDYFWRVRPLIGGSEVGQWSQIWKTRFNPALGLPAKNGPVLIRPTNGFELAEATPLLEWFPVEGAAAYDIEISPNQGFSGIVHQATVSYPAYAPIHSLAQRSLGAVDFGVYYWRVRQSPSGVWSETRRFQVAAQSQWKVTRTLGTPENRLQIGSDPAGDAAGVFDLTSLNAAQSSGYWYFGFHVPDYTGEDATYALYLDLDHQEGSGATFDARGYNVTTLSAYRPEYAIYIFQQGGVFSPDMVAIYRWTGTGWDTPNVLAAIGGDLNYDSGYVEIQVPNTAIGYQDTTGSYAISLLSLPPSGSGLPLDAVPSVPNISSTGIINRFANVTERINLLMPSNDAGLDPTTFPTVQPFFWDWPVLAPWAGATLEAYLDQAYTTLVAKFEFPASYRRATENYGRSFHTFNNDLMGDNTYFWRVRPLYTDHAMKLLLNGVWSQGWRFERQGFVPENLTESVTFATPTFSWDMVEGAEYYELQVDDDPNFKSPAINISTRQNSYTGINTLDNGTYFWRVRVRRYRRGEVINDWSASRTFTLSLPQPDLLSPTPGQVVKLAPTFCWAPLLESNPSGDPVLAAWKYRVQISQEPSFSKIFDTIDTEQTCWTPTKGYDDGTFYWRVAMIDGNKKLGDYSDIRSFTKQYPVTTLINPISGTNVQGIPTFIWEPVDGAASYRLEISLFSSFSPTIDAVTTHNVRYTPTKALNFNQNYYWRVAIIDADKKYGPFVGETIIVDDTYDYQTYLPLIVR